MNQDDNNDEIFINFLGKDLYAGGSVRNGNFIEISQTIGPAVANRIRITIEDYHWVVRMRHSDTNEWQLKAAFPIQNEDESCEATEWKDLWPERKIFKYEPR